ncbi:MAG: uracil-DNA glycosylase [Gemmatimonadales bacterium]|nr:uracil-DNA glycosylase [Gemmatimonadales bacterium]
MNDATRRWLELQRDLGGDEVIFDRPLAQRELEVERAPATVTPSPRKGSRPARTAPAPAPDSVGPTIEKAPDVAWRIVPTGDPAAEWRTGAPPIPGPGLAVTFATPTSGHGTWASLEEVAEVVSGCVRCPLAAGRILTVPGEGNPSAGLFCVGEGPGESEDKSGRPFVGRAGAMLDKILEVIEAPRATVYIGNVVKCRPPRNRAPLPDERDACMPYLHRQIELVRPKVILALGTSAAEALLGVRKPLGELRLKVHRYNGIPLVVTYHPAALLRNPNWKRPAWDDVRIARQLLDAID